MSLWNKVTVATITTVMASALVSSIVYCESVERSKSISPNAVSASLTRQYITDLQEHNHSLEQLQQIQIEIGKSSTILTSTDYGALMNQICDDLISKDFHNAKQYILENRYAMSALNRQNGLALNVEVPLLIHASRVDIQSQETGWLAIRKANATHFVGAWSRIQTGFNPKFDVETESDRIQISVTPPPETNLMPGTDPEKISDAHLRSIYLKDIQKNEDLKRQVQEQEQYREYISSFVPKAEKYLVDAYSTKPYNIQEATTLLKTSCIPLQSQQNLLRKIKKQSFH